MHLRNVATSGGGLPVVGVGGSVVTHTAGSVTTQSIAFKYVMANLLFLKHL